MYNNNQLEDQRERMKMGTDRSNVNVVYKKHLKNGVNWGLYKNISTEVYFYCLQIIPIQILILKKNILITI